MPSPGMTQMSLVSNGLVQRLAQPLASQDRAHVKLNSGHQLPLFGWGASDTKGQNTIDSVQEVVNAGDTVNIA